MAETPPLSSPRVAIVGGGLAGLAAAVALITRGCHVEVFEARRKLGGRAGSYVDRASGESIDHCQHVAMGCCTNFLDFCQRTGIGNLFTRYRTLHFFGPDGRRCDFTPSRWLPAPLHLIGPLLSLNYLSIGDKLMDRAGNAETDCGWATTADAGNSTVLSWLREQRQSPAAIERFWKVVLVTRWPNRSTGHRSPPPAKCLSMDFWPIARPRDVLVPPRFARASFMIVTSPAGCDSSGAAIHLETPVAESLTGGDVAAGLRLGDGSEPLFDFVIRRSSLATRGAGCCRQRC